MRDDLTFHDGDVRRCCAVDPRQIGVVVRLAQHARRLLNATIWRGLTAALGRLGLTLITVQILCVDRSRGLVLVLRPDECPSGCCPVQGLRKQRGELHLRPETAEGLACWSPVAEAIWTLRPPTGAMLPRCVSPTPGIWRGFGRARCCPTRAHRPSPRMPSPADYWLMSSLRARLGGGPVGERVCFPDGSSVEYGVTGAGHHYFRRPGEARLFPAL